MSTVAEAPVEKDVVVAVICSIFPNGDKTVTRQRSYRGFTVNVWEDDEPYVLTEIHPAIAYADLGESKFNNQSKQWSRRQEYKYTAREVAADLCKELNSNVMGTQHSFLGFFICDGLKPTEKELARETEKLKSFLSSLVRDADKQWSGKPVHELIPDVARKAATFLHLDKPWLYKVEGMEKCPACKTPVIADAAVCASCNAVIDEDAARKFFPERFAAKEPKSTQK